MKKILRSIFLFSLVSILMFSSNTVLIYSSAAIEAEFPTDGTVERLSQDNAFVHSSTSYNIVRHNLDTSSTDYLYFTNSAATMRSSTFQEDEVLFSEGYFPESSNNSSTRDIIGTDDRIRVSDTTVAPFSAVCRIICQFNNVFTCILIIFDYII